MTVDYMKHTLGYFHFYFPIVAEMNNFSLTSTPLMSTPSMSGAPIASMDFSGDSSPPLQPSKNKWYLVSNIPGACTSRLQSLDWTRGLDRWTDTKNYFMVSNDTHSPVELCGSPAALFLATWSQSKQLATIQYSWGSLYPVCNVFLLYDDFMQFLGLQMRFGSLVNVLVVITLYCTLYNGQSDCMLGALLVPSYKHHLDYQMSVVLWGPTT